MKFPLKETLSHTYMQVGVALALAGLVGYGIYRDMGLVEKYSDLSQEKKELEEKLNVLEIEKAGLEELSREQKEVIDMFAPTIENISGTVGNLQKLADTDEELLKKYSKVYFLNENYIPQRLAKIDSEYLLQPERELQIHADVWPRLEDLLEDAEDDGIALKIASAYRSFGTQAALKAGYTVSYGSGANTFSADQGYSEHQLGTTLDFTTTATGGAFSTFESDPGYKWLTDNAWKYGFVLSYPKGNAYYKFEPWHWRYVGEELARYLHNENKYFYDLDQREIDKYLITIFD